MGVVYRVRHRVLGREFALKALRADIAQEEQLGARFLREAQSAASINHPNVCEITDFGELEGNRPYFVMELLTGDALSTLLSGDRLPLGRVVHLSEQVARALDAAHRAGVVHRDLKPDNIIVEVTPTEERIKVVDFGLAQVAGQSRLTRPGIVFGTPHYMSPEQASGGEVDQRADVYALGIMMYEMLTGRVPFEAETYMGVLSKHLYLDPEPPSQIVADSSIGALEGVVMRCLKKRPDERYPSMSELLDDLRAIVRVEAGQVSVRPGQIELPSPAPEAAVELTSPRPGKLVLSLLAVGD
jgi:serine/threonine-protein kinase